MKRLLPLLLSVVFSGATLLATAQCAIYDVVVSNERNISSAGSAGCNTTVDISFTIENNNGNKFIFVHLWLQPDYPNYFQCINGQNAVKTPPKAANLAKAFANIAIENDKTSPSLATSYRPDPTVKLNPVASIEKVVNADGSARITLKGVQLTVPVACGDPFVVVADAWSSQAAQAQTVQCATCRIDYSSLSITGLVNCLTKQYTITVNSSATTVFNGDYKLYIDLNGNGELDNTDVVILNTTQFSVPATGTVTLTGTVADAYLGRDILIEVNEQGSTADRLVQLIPSTECAVLPVQFSMFSATRQNSNVQLKWETAMEENNKGFYVQRNTGEGWKDLTFVNTKAPAGNSTSLLGYEYTDVNSFSGITQYRLQQVDIDGKSKYSEIRAVAGADQRGRSIVYPNPSNNGLFNIVFDHAAAMKDVYISDVSGRTFRQWKNVTNNLQVANLAPGIYTLRIVDVQSGKQTAEKIIINKQ